MILKHYNFDNNFLDQNNFFLLYGKNEGLKNEIRKKIVKNNKTLDYDESEILSNELNFIESIKTKSLFDENKIIVIKRVSDKIFKVIEEVFNWNYPDIKIIIITDNLEKRSKLRSFFEKEKKVICIAFYPDNEQTLSKLAHNFLKKTGISLSSSNINSVVMKCNGDREYLFRELKKIEEYSKNGKKLTTEVIYKLTNLVENYSIAELIDNCLIKNKKKIHSILNENNFSNDDCIIIARTFMNKAKKILILSEVYQKNNNVDLTIASAKPPIFWKDKDIIRKQILEWSPNKIKKLIYKINELELLVKKNINNSINLIYDFIIWQASSKTNN